MQANVRKSSELKQVKTKKSSTESEKSSTKNLPEDATTKRKSYISSTPRNYNQKTTADIYSIKKKTTVAPKESKKPGNTVLTTKPITSITKNKTKNETTDKKLPASISNTPRNKKDIVKDSSKKDSVKRTAKDLPFVNVTVNSPPPHTNKDKNKDVDPGRQRQKTRTLNENEIKVLTSETVDNNEEMKNLNRKLKAKPKSFFVDLDDAKAKDEPKNVESSDDVKKVNVESNNTVTETSNEDYSYEDDFESYESDFESYHSDKSIKSSDTEVYGNDQSSEETTHFEKPLNVDEEKMLDSGSFELHEARKSANKPKTDVMDNILEDSEYYNTLSEDVKKASLPDEGFQEMSNSSGVASTKDISHTDVLDRELFINLKKSKDYKKRKLNIDRLEQRAKDVLSLVKLHEMSYVLFEMKPIPYEVYMATFGKSNSVQKSCQTFEDGMNQEMQTEHVFYENKWTQHPVQFSKTVYSCDEKPKRASSDEFLTKFLVLVESKSKFKEKDENFDNTYLQNPLRIYFDQKDGVGGDAVLPVADYEMKLKNFNFNIEKLKKFLNKNESRVTNILSRNSGSDLNNDFSKTSKWSFSKGYTSIESNSDDKLYLKNRKISKVVFSEQKSNLLITVHEKNTKAMIGDKCVVCVWDVSVAINEPVKILIAIDNVLLCAFRGNLDGILVGGLEDGSIHIWDLSEEAFWRDFVDTKEKEIKIVDNRNSSKTQAELDREWNSVNSGVDINENSNEFVYRACAYTSSVYVMKDSEITDVIVGLEFIPHRYNICQGENGKTIGQFCSLQRSGVLILWTIFQEKSQRNFQDMGKAHWSKTRLQKSQTIHILDYIDTPMTDAETQDHTFNLSAVKKRLTNKRNQNNKLKGSLAKYSILTAVKSDGPSTPRNRTVLPVAKYLPQSWESGLLCTDLKVMLLNNSERYLVAKNCGEILCCSRSIGNVKISKLSIAHKSTKITTIEPSPQHLPYFLAGTDDGNVYLCSLRDPDGCRVLLNLVSKSMTPPKDMEQFLPDRKGRFLGTVAKKHASNEDDAQISLKSIKWLTNPCRFITLTDDGTIDFWDLTRSDMKPSHSYGNGPDFITLCRGEHKDFMATLSTDGTVEVHKLASNDRSKQQIDLFKKYIDLL